MRHVLKWFGLAVVFGAATAFADHYWGAAEMVQSWIIAFLVGREVVMGPRPQPPEVNE